MRDFLKNIPSNTMKYKIIPIIVYLFSCLLFAQQSEIDSLEVLIPSLPDDSTKVTAMNNLAFAYSDVNPTKGLEVANKSLKLAKQIDYKHGTAAAYNVIGLNQNRMGDYWIALKSYEQALSIYESLGKKPRMAAVYNNIGNVYVNVGKPDEALRYFLNALKIKEEIGDERPIATTLVNISRVYGQVEKYDKALELLYRALKIRQDLNDVRNYPYLYNQLSTIHSKMGDYDSSEYYCQKVLESSLEVGNTIGVILAHTNFGNILGKKGEYQQAIDHFNKSNDLKRKIGRKTGISTNLMNIAEAYHKMGNNYMALQYGTEAYKYAQEFEEIYNIKVTSRFLSAIYKEMNNFKRAFDFLEIYYASQDSIISAEKLEEIAKMEMKFEFDKQLNVYELEKQNELALKETELEKETILRNYAIAGVFLLIIAIGIIYRGYLHKKKSNTEIAEQKRLIEEQKEEVDILNQQLVETNKRLEELNATKDTFFNIIGHDLRTPYSAILGLTDILKNEYQTLDKEELYTFIVQLSNASQQSYQLLENLLQWSRVQTGKLRPELKRLNLNEIFDETFLLLENSAKAKNITIIKDFVDEAIIKGDYLMIATTIRNLLSNAIKFTPKEGKITCFIKKIDDAIQIGVQDTGVGIPEEAQKKMFRIDYAASTPGTENEEGTGLGLILCKEFIEMNNGELSFTSEENKGSTFYFTLPEKK